MARRIRDLPDDEVDWPDLEEELVPEHDPMPESGGPFTRSFEYLHGARVTMDADLSGPTRLLTITAARSILRIAEETETPIPDEDEERIRRVAGGDLPETQDRLLEALARLSGFVERQIRAEQTGSSLDSS